MKKAILVMFLLLIVSAFARVGSIDNECQDNGFDYGVAKYECDNGSWTKDEGDTTGYVTSAEGEDCMSVDWMSSPAVSGVVAKAGQNSQVFPGGTTGRVSAFSYNPQENNFQELSHITLCVNETEVPEFGTFGIVAVLVALSVFFVLRK